MEKTSQDSARAKIITAYEERAFEALALYSYWGNRYSAIEKQLNEIENRIKEIKGKIAEIENSEKPYSVENKEKKKALQKDLEDYEKRVEGVGTMANNLLKKATNFRVEGVTILEQIEFVREYKFKTPEEIEADKKAEAAKVEPTPVAGKLIDPAGVVTAA